MGWRWTHGKHDRWNKARRLVRELWQECDGQEREPQVLTVKAYKRGKCLGSSALGSYEVCNLAPLASLLDVLPDLVEEARREALAWLSSVEDSTA